MSRFFCKVSFYLILSLLFYCAKSYSQGNESEQSPSSPINVGVNQPKDNNKKQVENRRGNFSKKQIKSLMPVEFYKPFFDDIIFNNTNSFKITENDFEKFQKKVDIDKFAVVHISGKTLPGSRIYIATKALILLNDKNEISKVRTRSVVDKIIKSTDKNGYFKFSFRLPLSKVQVPLKILPPKNKKDKYKSSLYQLSFSISSDYIKLLSHKHLRESPLFSDKYSVWLGMGANYLIYKQKSDKGFTTDLELKTFKLPTFFSRFWYKIDDDWNMNFTFNVAPGEANSAKDSSLVLKGNPEYNWLIFAIEGSYYPSNWRFDHFNGEARLGTVFGFQHHIVPFLASAGNAVSEIEVVTNEMTLFATGMQYMLKKRQWIFESFIRIQTPLVTGDVFDIKNHFAFDGSLGVHYHLSRNWKYGVFWYGQMHTYKYFHDDKYISNFPSFGTNPIDGEQSLFFSNIEARIGYAW